ncbi:unnamed protein product [Ilex paraguariensis]|uniref:AT3G52170-like helix-turn-helix domain-containing protein n=1 Tax=Ilex paraguariensis TaxID=185542 RepID=A0ABC8SR04_9AQUA
MHAIKGGWVGQTFALAKCNDSGGRKSRVRRSKEERKAMVESFIKKYQKSNNGSFPSLNLTHKEVGGSFYTVREIVREIIQENRVLGPAKISPDEQQNNDIFFEQYPLGSISLEPQTHLASSNEINIAHIVPSHHQSAREEVLNSTMQSPGTEYQQFENEQFVNGNSPTIERIEESDESFETHVPNYQQGNHHSACEEQVLNSTMQSPGITYQQFENEQFVDGNSTTVVRIEESDESFVTHVPSYQQGKSEEHNLYANGKFPEPEYQSSENGQNSTSQAVEEMEESDEPIDTESEVRESLDGEEIEAKELETSKPRMTHPIADVVVETFPLRPVSNAINGWNGKSGEPQDASGTLKEKDTQTMKLEARNSKPNEMNFVEDSYGLIDEKATANQAGTLLEQNSGLMDEKATIDIGDSSLESPTCPSIKGSIVVDSNDGTNLEVKDASPSRIMPVNTPKSISAETLNSTSNISSHGHSISEEAILIKNKLDIQHGGSSQGGSSVTFDRINLESWEGKSVKSLGPETNPLLALFKAFVAAFVKFWSE